MNARGRAARAEWTGRAPLVIVIVTVAIVIAAFIAPAVALATVQPFATNAPGGSGTGGGVGEIWPIGFGFVTGQDGLAWGDGAGDTYQALTRDVTYISGTDPVIGGPQRLLAFVNKNPSINKPYIKLSKNGVDVPGFDSYVQTPNRNAAIIVPDFTSYYPIFYPGAVQNNAWYIPLTGYALDPGTHYELRFLKGIKANNGMTAVEYVDPGTGLATGYIQSPTAGEELAQYDAKQYDTFRFRNENVPATVGAPYGYGDQIVTDEDSRYEDFIFKFQTYADISTFTSALANANSALTTATLNSGYGPGQVDPARVANLSSVVASATAAAPTMNQRLQPDVDAAVTQLEDAIAQAQVLNTVPPPVTTISGLPASGVQVDPVSFSLTATDAGLGVAGTYYILDGGAQVTYTTTVTVSSIASHTVSYWSVDTAGNAETTHTATFKIAAAWTSQASGTANQLASVTFVSPSTGWAVGAAGTILKTSDSGITWTQQSSGVSTALNALFFLDANNGWAVGASNRALHTADGGATWTSQTSPLLSNSVLYAVFFTDANNGWLVGNQGRIAHTTNGGATWLAQTSGFGTSTIQGLFFTDANTGWIAGQAGKIAKTTDGGTTWVLGTFGTAAYTSLWFADANTGWVVGASGTIRQTTDAGASWTAQTSPTANQLNGVHFLGASSGYAVGNAGTILKTANGGATWLSQVSGTTSNLLSVRFADQHSGWAVGAAGTIRTTVRPVTTATGIPAWAHEPVTFALGVSGDDAGPFSTYFSTGGGFAAYSTPVTVSTLGTTTVSFYSVDACARKETTKTATIRIENVAPVSAVDGVSDGGVFTEPVTFTVSAFDADSGVAHIYYTLDSGSETTFTGAPVKVIGMGSHTLLYRSTDNAGNAETPRVAHFSLLPGVPETTLSGVPSGWTTGPVTFSLEATQAEPPLTSYYAYGVDATQTYSGPVTYSVEGTTTLSYYSVDVAGRTEPTKTATIRIDMAAPATTISGLPAGPTLDAVTFSLAGTDLTSGVAHTYYTLDGGAQTAYTSPVMVSAPATHTVTYWSTDVAGNVEDAHSATFKIFASWAPQNPGTANTMLVDIDFADAENGWAVGYDADYYRGIILHTTDGGSTWTTQIASDLNYDYFNAIVCSDAKTAWVFGASGVRHTTDGGATWTPQTSPGGGLFSAYMVDANNIWAGGDGFIIHTANGGVTWELQPIPIPASLVNAFAFADLNNGWAVGSRGAVMHTTDGGATWTAQSAGIDVITDADVWDVACTDANHAWAITKTLHSTADGGATWTEQDFGSAGRGQCVVFTDPSNGWVLGYNGTNLHTGDGGATWAVQDAGTTLGGPYSPAQTYQGAFIDRDNGWAVGIFDTIVRTITPATSISGVPSGWTTAPVTFSLATGGVDDAAPFTTSYRLGGGAVTSYTAPVTVSDEGTTVVSYRSTDLMGRSETTKTASIRIDTHAPITTASGLPSSAATADVTFSLSAVDTASGVSGTAYTVDGVPGVYSAPVTVSGPGAHTVTYWSTDAAGNIEGAHSASFTIASYTLSYNAGSNGSIVGPSPQTVSWGSNGTTVTATPTTGYHFASWSDAYPTAVRQDLNVTASLTATATFAINTYTLGSSAGAGGSISATQTVNHGSDSASFTITPNTGYHVATVTVDGGSVGAVSSYKFTNVTANHTIAAAFAINTYTLTYNAGAGGSIVGPSPQTVSWGSNGATVTATPATGYHFVSWSDGYPTAVRQDLNVTASITATATFAANTYTLSPSAGANGSISPATTQTVNAGTNTTFTITPSAGYHVASVLVDGISQGAITTYTFTNVQANHTIAATFAINTYTITPSAGANGSISPATPTTVNYGANQTFNFTPASGYNVATVTVDGASAGSPVSYTFNNVTADHSISVSFADKTAPNTISDASATYLNSAAIHLTPTDAASGVAHTYYKLDGGAQTEGLTINVSAYGSHALEFWSVDAAGNIETHKVANFAIDENVAPTTTSDAVASYVGTATIHLSATDNAGGSGVAATYWSLDGGSQTSGTTCVVTATGAHTIQFWSVDVAGNTETPHKSASFTITSADTTAPHTTSDAVASYTTTATIHLAATDNAGGTGVAHTYWRLDGGAQAEGTTCVVTALGNHTIQFWSVDVAGNVETYHSATFAVVAAVQPTSITIRTNATSVKRGKSFILSGAVVPGSLIGTNVQVMVKYPTKAYYSYSSLRTCYMNGAVPSWWYRYNPLTRQPAGVYKFYAFVPASANFLRSQSPTLNVTFK